MFEDFVEKWNVDEEISEITDADLNNVETEHPVPEKLVQISLEDLKIHWDKKFQEDPELFLASINRRFKPFQEFSKELEKQGKFSSL